MSALFLLGASALLALVVLGRRRVVLDLRRHVELRVDVDYERLIFAYRLPGEAWRALPQVFDASIVSDEAGPPTLPGLTIDVARVQTNLVIFEPPSTWEPQAFIRAVEEKGVLLTPFGGRRIRAMTHADVSSADCERAVEIIAEVVRAGQT